MQYAIMKMGKALCLTTVADGSIEGLKSPVVHPFHRFKFPVSHPPPASISSENQKIHYFHILLLFPLFLVYSRV